MCATYRVSLSIVRGPVLSSTQHKHQSATAPRASSAVPEATGISPAATPRDVVS